MNVESEHLGKDDDDRLAALERENGELRKELEEQWRENHFRAVLAGLAPRGWSALLVAPASDSRLGYFFQNGIRTCASSAGRRA